MQNFKHFKIVIIVEPSSLYIEKQIKKIHRACLMNTDFDKEEEEEEWKHSWYIFINYFKTYFKQFIHAN